MFNKHPDNATLSRFFIDGILTDDPESSSTAKVPPLNMLFVKGVESGQVGSRLIVCTSIAQAEKLDTVYIPRCASNFRGGARQTVIIFNENVNNSC